MFVVALNAATVLASAGTYNNLRITVNGCTSVGGVNASLSDPNPPPTPTISVENNCGVSILTASDYTGTLKWSTGETTESISVNAAGNYSLTQTVDGCTSDAATAIVTLKPIPAIVNITENNPTVCLGQGSLDFTFTGVTNGIYSIAYDGGSFTNVSVSGNKATVSAPAGSYNNLIITVNGCSSAGGINASITALPPPAIPTISVQDNCGESVLTASNYTGTLLWSTNETTESIIVNTAGNYSVTQTVGSCTSDAATVSVTPKAIPSITNVTENDPEVCQGQGSLDFTFSGVPNGTYSIAYNNGSFAGVVVTENKASVQANTGTFRNLTITVEGCTSADGVNASLSDPNPPPAPTILVEDKCGESVLTAANYTGTLLWNTGEGTESITVTKAGEYFVTQTVDGCTSDAATAAATPGASTLKPEVDLTDYCGESQISINNLSENALFVWEFDNTTHVTASNSITVSEAGEYTIYQKLGNCTGLDTTLVVNPFVIPSPPTASNKEICASEPFPVLTAEATSEINTNIIWFDSVTGGNEIQSPVLDTIGTITYYAEAQNSETGCKSESRTPVTLSMKPNPKNITIDTTIIGKPHNNVAVIIFPKDSLNYQWYLNNNEIADATNQYYYIFESDRLKGNVFSVEVKMQNGCIAKFNYPYAENSAENGSNAFNGSDFIDGNNSFIIYPNPVNSNLNIAVNSKLLFKDEKLIAKIYSNTGALLMETPLDKNPKTIDIKNLRPGFYSVTIYSAGNRLITKKLVVTQH